jgi:hypothetical protein
MSGHPSVPWSIPAKLEMENIPEDEVQELPGGGFKWGPYKTDPSTLSREEVWAFLNR